MTILDAEPIGQGPIGSSAIGGLVVTTTGASASGSLSASLGSITASGAGSVTIRGSLSAALESITSSATGDVATTITGSASVNIGEVASSATGDVTSTINGSASITIGAITGSLTGDVTSSPVAGDPYFSNVTLLMHGESFKDEISGSDATNSGSVATIDAGTVKFGTGSIKTGASALYFADSSSWDFGTSPFTIEFWVNFTATGGTRAIISHYAVGGPVPNFEFVLQSGALKLLFADGSGTHNSNATSGQSYVAGTWYAVCLERDASKNLRIYVNGVQKSKTTNYTYSFSGFNAPLIIGSLRPGVTTWDALAYFDEIRITKGVARYASDSGYTVQTAAFPDTALVTHSGVLSTTLDPITSTGDGLVYHVHYGALERDLDPVALTASGSVTNVITGQLSIEVGPVTLSAEGDVTDVDFGTGAATLDSLTVAAVGVHGGPVRVSPAALFLGA